MTNPAENRAPAPETAATAASSPTDNAADPSERILFAITADQFIAEYEDLAYFRRQDKPGPSPEYWPPWAALGPERQESLLRQAAVLLEKRLQTPRWLQLEDLVYTLVDPARPAPEPAPSPETPAAKAARKPRAAEPPTAETPAAAAANPNSPQGK